jgi:hypothetical protein
MAPVRRMQFVSPDILSDVSGLSLVISCTALVLGFLVWLLGWREHRFWIVLTTTISAGILGLYSNTTQPVLAGLLLAIAAGVLALTLVRLIAFAASGLASCLAVNVLAPQWHQPLLPFLAGGLFGLLLFRVWTMVLTSVAGTLLMAYSTLCLLHKFAKVDVVALTEKRITAINCICGGVAFVGLLGQFILDRRRGKGRSPKRAESSAPKPPQRPWWIQAVQWYRRAG